MNSYPQNAANPNPPKPAAGIGNSLSILSAEVDSFEKEVGLIGQRTVAFRLEYPQTANKGLEAPPKSATSDTETIIDGLVASLSIARSRLMSITDSIRN